MGNVKRINQLVNIARLYYEHNHSQQMIAEKTGFSRPYVSKLIKEARTSGIVEIKINDPNGAESPLEFDLRERFGLEKVIVMPLSNKQNENLLVKFSEVLSRYLNSIVEDNDIIGVSYGNTLYVSSLNLNIIEEVRDIKVVQLCGAISMTDKNIYAVEIPKKLAEAFKGTPYILPLPAIVDNIEAKNVILKDKHINEVVEMGKRANIAIYSVGIFGHDRTLARAGYVSSEKVDELLSAGAVGDMFSRVININGEICDMDLDQRTIGIELEDLKKKKYSIAVAGGDGKAQCIYAALAGGYANVLITDEYTAREIIKLHDEIIKR